MFENFLESKFILLIDSLSDGRKLMATLAFISANNSAVDKPIPDPPPVINTENPLNGALINPKLCICYVFKNVIYISKIQYNIKLVKILMGKFLMMNKLKTWHIDLIEKVQKHTGLSNYQIIWLSFAEGLIIGLFIGYFI